MNSIHSSNAASASLSNARRAEDMQLENLAGEPAASEGTLEGKVSFRDVLWQSLGEVNEFDRKAQSAVASALTSDDLTQAEVFTAVKQADLAFRTMLQIRNKLVDAYNELKNLRM
jgi:flagellar hook-basal body complex protein FliE